LEFNPSSDAPLKSLANKFSLPPPVMAHWC
jgi:hypothetical protein